MKQIIYLLVGIAIFLNSCSGSGSRAAKEGKNASVLIDRSVTVRNFVMQYTVPILGQKLKI
jgi:PBP1b-binding outer membrane lipoprotein LpoB